MAEFNIRPDKWARLPRMVRLALHYYRVMKENYLADAMEDRKREAELERMRMQGPRGPR